MLHSDSEHTFAYHYQWIPDRVGERRTGGLTSKFMALLAALFLVATIGTFIGEYFLILPFGLYLPIVLASLFLLILLKFLINTQIVNICLLFLFLFITGFYLSPLIRDYFIEGRGNIVGEAFLIIAAAFAGSAIYARVAKRSFTRILDYLFFNLILLLMTGTANLLFRNSNVLLIIVFACISIFCNYLLFYARRGERMDDTLSNAIGLVVSFFTYSG